MDNVSEWFNCPECNESENLSVKQVLGLGNFSVNIECGCGFRHVERDPSSDNWNKSIKFKQFVSGRKFKAPETSRVFSKACQCPKCASENVESWVYSENAGLDKGETVGHLRLNCRDCDANTTTAISH